MRCEFLVQCGDMVQRETIASTDEVDITDRQNREDVPTAETPRDTVKAILCQKKYVKDSGKKWVYALFYVTALMLLSFYWHSMKSNTWPSKVVFDCNQQPPINNVTNTSRLDLLEEVSLQRMLYDRPDTMKPPRSDVLIMTPWFSPIVWNGTYNIDILNAQFHQKDVRIGLTLFAIKKYTVFVQTFIETAENFFMVGQKVNYYVFTDRVSDIPNITLSQGRNMVILKVPSYKRWQEVCMRRMEMIRDHLRQRIINEVDYLVCADIDMKFSDDVGLEILSDVFGTLHPGFHRATRAEFTYERRQESTAYIPTDEGDFYYAAGYFGGTVEEVYKLTNFCHNAMMTDKENHIEAIWHDESYLNKYFLYHKPTKILSPEYLWDNGFGVPEHIKRRRFVAVPKNHNAIRNKRDLQDYSRVKLKFHSCQSF